MTNKNQYAEIGLRSARRAAAKVLADALLHQRPLPIWENGEVKYKLPTQSDIDKLLVDKKVP